MDGELREGHPIDQALSFAQRVETVELFQSPPSGETGYRIVASAPLGESARDLATGPFSIDDPGWAPPDPDGSQA
jgi:hypothetical protein